MGLLGVIVAAIALRVILFDNFPLSPDEGIHLMWLRLLAAGYHPYREVYITYPPLYPLALQAVWSLWPGEVAQRWFSVGYTIFGAVGVALVARRLAGPAAGIAAAVLTLFSPPLVEPSRAVLGEFPSIAWSVWAVWLAWLYLDAPPGRGRWLWLMLSGLCLSASLLTKLLSPFMLALIPLMMAAESPHSGRGDRRGGFLQRAFKPFLIDLIGWGLAVVLPALVLFAVYDVGPLVQQVVTQRLEARVAYTGEQSFWPPRYERGAMFFGEDPALVILGLIGLGWLGWLRQKRGWIVAAWLGLALVMLAIHNPIRYKHFLILIPPLAVVGGTVIAGWLAALQGRLALTPVRRQIITIGGGLILVGLVAWQAPVALAVWQAKANVPQPPTDERELLAFIQEMTAPDDCLITDDMPLVYWSGRMAPPELAEVSSNRLEAGALTTPQLQAITDTYDCQMVAAVSNRIGKYLPDYMDWVKTKYLGLVHYNGNDLFFAKADTDPRPARPLWANFDRQIIFHGYTLPSTPAAPGARVPLTLVWQAQQKPAMDYAIFVQLRNAAHQTLASADHQPYQGLVPTSAWPAGAVIQEVTWLALPPDIPPGDYHLYVGLYRPDTLTRLPLQDDLSGENALILGPLVVQ